MNKKIEGWSVDFKEGFFSSYSGYKFLSKHPFLFLYLIIPFGFYLGGLGYLAYQGFYHFQGSFPEFIVSYLPFLKMFYLDWIFWIVFFILIFILIMFFHSIFFSVFYSLLAEKSLQIIKGSVKENSFLESVKTSVKMLGQSVLKTLIFLILYLVFLIPFLIFPILSLFWWAMTLAFDSMDYSFEANRMRVRDRFRLVFQKWGFFLGLASFLLVMTVVIPILGLFLTTPFSISGGALWLAHLSSKNKI